VQFKRLVFGAIVFHGVLLERKKFGALGFNKMYDFNDSDLVASLDMLCDLCNREVVPFDAIEYMVGEITYGGRVTEELDFRVIRSTLRLFLSRAAAEQEGFSFSESGCY